MLKNISLRMRLTLLSALVMASVAVILTSMFLFGADRIFVRDLEQKMTFQPQDIIITSVKKEGVPNENMDLQEVTVSLKKAGTQFNLWGMAALFLVLILYSGCCICDLDKEIAIRLRSYWMSPEQGKKTEQDQEFIQRVLDQDTLLSQRLQNKQRVHFRYG